MPAQWVSMWMKFGPDNAPLTYQETACKLWWRVTGGDLDDLFTPWLAPFATQLAIQYSNSLLPAIPSSCSVSFCNIDITTATHNAFISQNIAHVGSAPHDFYSPAQSCCVIKRTSKIGRSGIGRMFISCVPAAWLDKGKINATGLAAYQLCADQLNANFHYSFGIVNPITLKPSLHSLQDNDLTPIDSQTALHIPTYLYRRRFRS